MIPFKIKFLVNLETKDYLVFESNEKPFKGDVFLIESNGTTTEYKVTDVRKVVVRQGDTTGLLEYHCNVEKHETKSVTIGFK